MDFSHKKTWCWTVFIKKRFNPFFYIPAIALFFLAHYSLCSKINPDWRPFFNLIPSSIQLFFLFAGTFVFFFKLRLFDEIKDHDLDLKSHLSDGTISNLLKLNDFYKGIAICFFIELVAFSLSGLNGLMGIGIAWGYSLLMFKEFFIKKVLRLHLIIYALSHTAISIFLGLAIISAISSKFIWNFDLNSYLFLLNNWFLFSLFEFSRKNFLRQEKEKKINSYSKKYSRLGTVFLSLLMASFSLCLFSKIKPENIFFLLILLVIVLFLASIGLICILSGKKIFTVLFKTVSFSYILLFYLLFSISNLTG